MKRKVVGSIIIGCSSFVKRFITTEAKLEILCHRIMVQKQLHEKSNKQTLNSERAIVGTYILWKSSVLHNFGVKADKGPMGERILSHHYPT